MQANHVTPSLAAVQFRFLVTATSPNGNPFSTVFSARDESEAIKIFRQWLPGAYLQDSPVTARKSKWQ